MGQLLIRNLDDAVILRLKSQAERKGVSLEQHLRELLAEGSKPDIADMIAQNAASLRASGYRMRRAPEDLIREDRER